MSNNNNTNDYAERERKVIELYEQNKSTRYIAESLRMSLRDIGIILKKHGLSHGIALVKDNGNDNNSNSNRSHNEKATQAYELYDKGNKPVQVAIQLSLSEREATRYYTEYWRLRHLYKLHSIYKEFKGDLSPILKVYSLLRSEGVTTYGMEWFANMVKTGVYKIPEIQTKYARLKDEVEMIDHKKVVSKHELEDISNRITCLHIVMSQLSAACDGKRNEFAYLQNEVQQLEGYLFGLRNNIQRKMENENYS